MTRDSKNYTSNMDNSTIYNNTQGIITFSKWIRILPVVKVRVLNSPKIENTDVSPKENQSCSGEIKNKPESYCYLKYSKTHSRLNTGVLIVLAAFGIFEQAFLYNLANNAIQKVGFVVFILTFFILPLAVVFYCNKNTPKVRFALYIRPIRTYTTKLLRNLICISIIRINNFTFIFSYWHH